MTDRELFGAMCRDAFLAKCQAEIDAWDEGVVCTPDHYRKLSKILGVKVRPPRPAFNKKLIALLVAAALLLLTACAAFIYRDKLRGLFVERLGDRDRVTADCVTDSKLDLSVRDICILKYVPKGFEMVENGYNSMNSYYKYMNSDGKCIIFRQRTKMTNMHIDLNVSDIVKYNIDYDIYFSYAGYQYNYTWYDDKYYYSISSDMKLSSGDLVNIINGIEIKE